MQFSPQALFDHLQFSVTGYVESYKPADDSKVYAVIFHIDTEQAEIPKPVLELKFALESDVKLTMADGIDEAEARWAPQFLVQPPVAVLCQSEASNGVNADPKGAAAREEMLDEITTLFQQADPSGEADTSEIGEVCNMIFTEACIDVANNLHVDGVIRDAFGRDVPVIVYHQNYDLETSSQIEMANPNREARDFLRWHYAEMGIAAPPEVPDELCVEDPKVLSCFESRYSSPEVFRQWATSLWEKFEDDGPFGALPVKATYDTHPWSDLELECYAALYPKDAFADLAEFDLYIQYTASVQSLIIEALESDPELDETAGEIQEMFLPAEVDEVIEGHAISEKYKLFLTGSNINQLLKTWSLPESMNWLHELHYVEGDAWATRHEGSLTAVTEEGYLSFFAVDSIADDEIDDSEETFGF